MPGLRCAVIGAGVVGLCVALRLAEAGATVTVLERDEPGGGATRSSFAWLNANNKTPRAYHDLNHAGCWPGPGSPRKPASRPGTRRQGTSSGRRTPAGMRSSRRGCAA